MESNTSYLQEEPLTLDALLEETADPECGALAVFGGTVRRHNEDKEVTRLDYSVYEPLAKKALADIERETEHRFGVTACRIRHRVGRLEIGELSVLVVVRAPHRAEAFEAARYAIDTVKHDVPIWKREEYSDGSHVFVKGCTLHAENETP
jgi:molybdopterin synthase catalytic subunit